MGETRAAELETQADSNLDTARALVSIRTRAGYHKAHAPEERNSVVAAAGRG
jgi:hypothetical protein